MSSNSYAQLIDDFEAGLLVIEGESLTDYISRMGGVDYDAKANGGIMGYAVGGNIINRDINKYQNIDNQMAKVNAADISSSKMRGFKEQNYEDFKEQQNLFDGTEITPYEFKGLKDGSITKPGSYSKPQARLTNEEYLSRNNNLTANANNIARDFTYDTTSPVPEDYDMQYTVGNEFNVTPQQTMFDKAKNFASSGLAKTGKLGIDVVNMLKNNNPLGFVSSLANTRNPLNPGSSNYDSNLQDQIDSLKGQTGTRITGTSDNLKFTNGLSMINDNKYGLGSVLAGKNVVSGFGTNNYEVSLQDYIDKMRGYKTRSTFQQAKLDRAKRELAAEQSRQQSALEAQLAAAARESARMGYQDYGQGGVQDGNYDTSNMDSNNNYSDPMSDDTE